MNKALTIHVSDFAFFQADRGWSRISEHAMLEFTGCSNEGPTVPLATRAEVVVLEEVDKAATSSAELWSTQLIRPGSSVLNLRGGSMTRRTWKSAHKLERAVQNFARDNDGIFPGSLDYPNLAGKTLLDYLPSGQKLRNAFTGLRTEPSGQNADYPGAIGYNNYVSAGINVGYVITARGADASEVLVLLFEPE